MLVMTRREDGARPTGQEATNAMESPEQQPLTGMPLFDASRQLSEETIKAVRSALPGWDVYGLKGEFDAWVNARPEERRPRDYQAAFVGFARRRLAGRS